MEIDRPEPQAKKRSASKAEEQASKGAISKKSSPATKMTKPNADLMETAAKMDALGADLLRSVDKHIELEDTEEKLMDRLSLDDDKMQQPTGPPLNSDNIWDQDALTEEKKGDAVIQKINDDHSEGASSLGYLTRDITDNMISISNTWEFDLTAFHPNPIRRIGSNALRSLFDFMNNKVNNFRISEDMNTEIIKVSYLKSNTSSIESSPTKEAKIHQNIHEPRAIFKTLSDSESSLHQQQKQMEPKKWETDKGEFIRKLKKGLVFRSRIVSGEEVVISCDMEGLEPKTISSYFDQNNYVPRPYFVLKHLVVGKPYWDYIKRTNHINEKTFMTEYNATK